MVANRRAALVAEVGDRCNDVILSTLEFLGSLEQQELIR